MTLGHLEAELCTVRSLFDGRDSYRVPIYQRNYAWQARQIEQLLDDISDAIRDDEPCYFLGNLVVTGYQGGDTENSYEVIDGQQRLTTLYLCLAALDTLTGDPTSALGSHTLTYEARPRAVAALRTVCTNSKGETSRAASPADDADVGIVEGANVVDQYLKQRSGALDLGALKCYLLDRVQVARTALPPKTDLNRYFEVMNTRGQQLEQADIVKARLMSKLPKDAATQTTFARIWEACADMDSYVQMSLTSGDTVLRAKLFGTDWTWLEPLTWDEVRSALTNDSASMGHEPVGQGLWAAIERYAMTSVAALPDDDDNIRFQSTIAFPTFLLHALKVLRPAAKEIPDGDDERLLDDKKLISRFDTSFVHASGQDVRDFVVDLLRLRNVFDAFVLKRQYTARTGEDGEWSLQRLVKQTAGRKTTAGYRSTFSPGFQDTEQDDDDATRRLLLLESMLRITYTSPRTRHWMTLLLDHVVGRHPREIAGPALVSLLQRFARNQVRLAYPFANEPTGFEIPRIVFTYLDYLLLQRTGTDPVGYRFGFRNSIEHFYPQHPDQEQHGAQVSPEHCDLLGNLALVSVRANSKFSNSLPGAKRLFREAIEQSPKLKVMADDAAEDNWDDAAVLNHQREMVQLLRRDIEQLPAPASAGC